MQCVDCAHSSWTFFQILFDKKQMVEWLVQHGVLSRKRICPKCDRMCRLNLNSWIFKCDKYVKSLKETQIIQKDKPQRCRFSVSIRKGTFFEGSCLSIVDICRFVYYWSTLRLPRTAYIMNESTVIGGSNYCGEICVNWCVKQSGKIGGENIRVEINEAKFGKRKRRERGIEDKWMICGFEQGSDKLFIYEIENRSKETLLKAIEENILPGSTITSDCWKSYDCLQTEEFIHLREKNNLNFLDLSTSIETQNNKRTETDLCSGIPQKEKREEHFDGYLCEFLWKRTLKNHKERPHAFFKMIGELYKPDI